jgi:hypothetical protein
MRSWWLGIFCCLAGIAFAADTTAMDKKTVETFLADMDRAMSSRDTASLEKMFDEKIRLTLTITEKGEGEVKVMTRENWLTWLGQHWEGAGALRYRRTETKYDGIGGNRAVVRIKASAAHEGSGKKGAITFSMRYFIELNEGRIAVTSGTGVVGAG